VQDPGDPPATFVDRGSPPTMTAYSPKGTNTDAAVPVFPWGWINWDVRLTYNCTNRPKATLPWPQHEARWCRQPPHGYRSAFGARRSVLDEPLYGWRYFAEKPICGVAWELSGGARLLPRSPSVKFYCNKTWQTERRNRWVLVQVLFGLALSKSGPTAWSTYSAGEVR